MHQLEPFYNWKDQYDPSEDERSPFFGVEHKQFEYTKQIYK
jgi:hypothetical protein